MKFDRVGDSSGRYNVLNLQRNRNDSSGKTYEFEIIGTYAALPGPYGPLPTAFCQLLLVGPVSRDSLLVRSHPLYLVTARAGGRRSGSSSGGRIGARVAGRDARRAALEVLEAVPRRRVQERREGLRGLLLVLLRVPRERVPPRRVQLLPVSRGECILQ